jgi:hypothetical protein
LRIMMPISGKPDIGWGRSIARAVGKEQKHMRLRRPPAFARVSAFAFVGKLSRGPVNSL